MAEDDNNTWHDYLGVSKTCGIQEIKELKKVPKILARDCTPIVLWYKE
jgi:hypothetical protein